MSLPYVPSPLPGVDMVQKMGCDRLIKEIDSRLAIMEAAKFTLLQQINALKRTLKGISWSPEAAINEAKNKIFSEMGNLAPKAKEYDKIVDIINACNFFKENSSFGRPSTLARSLNSLGRSVVNGAIRDLTGNLPEFNAANLINTLRKQLSTGSKINIMIPEVNKILTCLSRLCGTDVTSRVSRLQSLMNSLYVGSSGDLDLDALLTSAGLAPDKIERMLDVSETFDTTITNFESNLDAGVKRIKRVSGLF